MNMSGCSPRSIKIIDTTQSGRPTIFKSFFTTNLTLKDRAISTAIRGSLARRMAARPLHRENMMSRQIIATDLVDLCTFDVGRFKHIPKAFSQLPSGPKGLGNHLCESNELYQDVLAFVLSYVGLICSEIDFQIAMDDSNKVRLLPVDLTWLQWSAFAREVS